MKELVLTQFYLGTISAADLNEDLKGSSEVKNLVARHRIEDMSEEFEIHPEHLVKLCGAVLEGQLMVEYLNLIGFASVASDNFHWDADVSPGDRVADVLYEWSCPVVNHPLTIENVRLWKKYLKSGDYRLGSQPKDD